MKKILMKLKEFKTYVNETEVLKKNREEKLKEIQATLTRTKPIDFKSNETITILQHEYAITQSTALQPVLGTFGAGPCIILALYDNKNNIAVLAHIDAVTDIQSLSEVLHPLSKDNTVAHLTGGWWITSQNMYLEIVKLLNKENIRIINADIFKSPFASASSLAIDSRNGNIYSPVRSTQLSDVSDFFMRFKRIRKFCKSPLIEFKPISLIRPMLTYFAEETKKEELKKSSLSFLSEAEIAKSAQRIVR
jgi:peptide-N-terminal asparagine amidohydrolase